jgi:hypothetical protein
MCIGAVIAVRGAGRYSKDCEEVLTWMKSEALYLALD